MPERLPRVLFLIKAFFLIWSGHLHGLEWVQFSGDVYLSQAVLRETGSDEDRPRMFEHVASLLKDAKYNVFNLEGTITRTRFPGALKDFTFRMHPFSPRILRHYFHVATLANNHSMDFGYHGLFETLASLEDVGIKHTGAGKNLEQAQRPARIKLSDGYLCIYSLSTTYPKSFWASRSKPGTARLEFSQIGALIEQGRSSCEGSVLVFHWGAENHQRAKDYQRALAHLAIDHGATAVIGHHPHVLQPIEIYKGKPIIYSVGNFVFGSRPYKQQPEGMLAAIGFGKELSPETLKLTALNVNNWQVHFKPRPIQNAEINPLSRIVPESLSCVKASPSWTCKL